MKKLISFVLLGAALTMTDVAYGGDWLKAREWPEIRKDTFDPVPATVDHGLRADDPEVKISGETSPKGTTGPGCFKTIWVPVCTGREAGDGRCTRWSDYQKVVPTSCN